MDKLDIKGWGIHEFEDKQRLFEHIQALIGNELEGGERMDKFNVNRRDIMRNVEDNKYAIYDNKKEGDMDENNDLKHDDDDLVDYVRSSASDKFYDEQWCDRKITSLYGLKDEDDQKPTVDETNK